MEVVENEVVAVEESTAPTLANQFDIVDVELAAAAQQNFGDLVDALLDDESDYQGGKKKKSAWRKLARAFNISDEKICDRIIREEDHQIISAYFEVKAILPNGRYGVGVGDCSIFDKINKDDTEMPSNFELRKRFTNAEHDVIATAHTRAKSRAIADLIGAGEVSAEEIDNPRRVQRSSRNDNESKDNPKTNSASDEDKPKTRRSRRRRSKKVDDEEVIETKAEVVSEETEKTETSKSLQEFSKENDAIKKAINRLQSDNTPISKASVVDEIFKMFDLGQLTLEEYDEANNLLLNN